MGASLVATGGPNYWMVADDGRAWAINDAADMVRAIIFDTSTGKTSAIFFYEKVVTEEGWGTGTFTREEAMDVDIEHAVDMIANGLAFLEPRFLKALKPWTERLPLPADPATWPSTEYVLEGVGRYGLKGVLSLLAYLYGSNRLVEMAEAAATDAMYERPAEPEPAASVKAMPPFSCWFDHHGYCQDHTLGEAVTEGACMYGLVEALNEVDSAWTADRLLDLYHARGGERS